MWNSARRTTAGKRSDDHDAASVAMEYGDAKLDGDMAREDDLAPEILDIRPFCIPAHRKEEVQVVVRLLVSIFRPAPSRLLVLHSGEVLHEKALSGQEDSVTIPLLNCPPGVINVVVIAETPASPVTDDDETVTADDIEWESSFCEKSRVHISSVGPLPVLPKDSAKEMMDLFDSQVEVAKENLVPINDDKHYLLGRGHVFTAAQKSGIEKMLWHDCFRPLADDLDFLLNNVTPRDLSDKSLNSVEEESRPFGIDETKRLLVSLTEFFIKCSAFHTMSFVLNLCAEKGFVFDMNLTPEGLAKARLSSEGTVCDEQVECNPERKGTPGVFMNYSSDVMNEEQVELGIPEETFQNEKRNFPSSLLTTTTTTTAATTKLEPKRDLDDDGFKIWEMISPDIGSKPGESPGLVLQGLSEVAASMDALGPTSNEPSFQSDSEAACSKKEGKSVGGGGGDYPPPLIAPSFAEALLSTENTSLSMAVSTMLVSCWLYLVWGEWGIVFRTMAGVVSLVAGIFWMKGVRFKYRTHLVWISRICLITMLVGNGAGWFRCPCICNNSKEEECIGGVLQSLFWLFTSASGDQVRIARQMGLLAVEALAFFYSMSKQTPGCNKISIVGLVLFGEVISLMLSLDEFSRAMEGDVRNPKNVADMGSACCSSQSVSRFDLGGRKSKSE
ncbi:hypothetical protein BSKO_10657 [Bryopsis sp. KO-2023]|nr:hypothetical protein BSKO_10657 [Bryopsis sp. KO-2023]